MKKLFLLGLLALTASVAANAQFKFGVKAGANMSQVATDDDKMLVGFNTGIIGQFKFSESKFAIQPEVLYSLQGAKYSESESFGGVSYELNSTLKLQYISVPVMVQYYFTPTFNVELGPQISFLTSAEDKYKMRIGNTTTTDTEDIKDQLNTTDFGLNLGVAYQLPTFPLGFYARYTLGLSELAKDGGDDAGANRVFSLGAFVKF